ncbi:MAG: hypothetical protein U9M90_04800 [Patescibacteria group bacterium]|nr:hypothetical protein [Patescibacteria group bacterium]
MLISFARSYKESEGHFNTKGSFYPEYSGLKMTKRRIKDILAQRSFLSV